MKMFCVSIATYDPHVVAVWFRTQRNSPSTRFEVKMTTSELAELVARSIAKEHGMRKARGERAWYRGRA